MANALHAAGEDSVAVIEPGFAFFNPMRTPPHLWVVISDANEEADVVVVMLTTLRARSDTTCVIQACEHPWIKHQTVVAYNIAEWQSVTRLEQLIAQRMVALQPPLSAGLLLRIQQGALDSSRTPSRIKRAIRRTLNP